MDHFFWVHYSGIVRECRKKLIRWEALFFDELLCRGLLSNTLCNSIASALSICNILYHELFFAFQKMLRTWKRVNPYE